MLELVPMMRRKKQLQAAGAGLWQRLVRTCTRAPGKLVRTLFIILALTGGMAGAIWWFARQGGVRLLGGFVLGKMVLLCLGVALLVTFLRHVRPPRPTQRRRALDLPGATLLGFLLSPLRLLLVGLLLGALLIRSFHPVRANSVYVVIELADPVNDKAYSSELLRTAVEILQEHPDKEVEFVGTPKLGELVREAAGGRMEAADPRWWAELRQQQPLNDRLAALNERLKDQVGELVCVVSVARPSGRASPWPLGPGRLPWKWCCVDPAQMPRADHTQLVSYAIGQDAAAAPYVYVTIRVKSGEPVPTMRVLVAGDSVRDVPPSGHYGDYHTYWLTLPRHKGLEWIDFAWAGGTEPPIDQLKGIQLAKRQLKVKLDSNLDRERLCKLPLLEDQVRGPILFVDTDADVFWTSGGTSDPGLPTVRLAPADVDYTQAPSGFQLRRTTAYLKSALRGISLPSAGPEFRDLSQGFGGGTGTNLVVLTREAGQEQPLVFFSDSSSPRFVTMIVPKLQQFDQMKGNVPKAMVELLIWASSLAERNARDKPEKPAPQFSWLLEPSEAELPARSPDEPPNDGLVKQLLRGLLGELDANTNLAAANSLRTQCESMAWAVLLGLLLLAAAARVIEGLYLSKRARTT